MRLNPFHRTFQNRYEPEAWRAFAGVYWSALVALFTVAALSSIAYGAWQFTRPFNQAVSDAVVSAPRATLNRADIQKVLDGFDVRAVQFEERQSAPAMRDPS